MAVLDDNGLLFGATAAAPQHFNISASIGSNAITVTLNPCTIGFRNSTLTNGAVTTRQITSAITLTIASTDSFGLVTAAGNQRLLILACDTGSTIQLAASALVGGVALTEDNVITTATAATTGTQIKSSSVLSGVPYRIVGIVDATFTTAVGWGSLALVQGCGGIVGAGMRSLGYGQTWQSVTRSPSTTYYNTTGKPIYLFCLMPGSGSSTFTIGGLTFNAFTTAAATNLSPTFVIPPGAAYSYTGTAMNSSFELR